MKVLIKILYLFVLFCLYTNAQNPDLEFSHLTSQDGLGSNSVFAILQDKAGFLWFGTYDGLSRYDGYKFDTYRNIDGDSTSISENKIRSMIEDKEGNLWIGTWYMGLNMFNPITEKFTRYLHDKNNPSSISNNSIISLCQDSDGFIWIGTAHGGLNKFDKSKGKFIQYNHSPGDHFSLSDSSVYSIYEDREGILWIGTGNKGINKYNKHSDSFLSYGYDPANPKSISSNWVLSFLEDRSGNFWIGTATGGLNKFKRNLNEFDRYSKGLNSSACSNYIWCIFEDTQGTLWIGTDNAGIEIFDWHTGEFKCIAADNTDPERLNDNTINSIYEDKSGVLWFGTWNGGLNKFNKFEKKFVTIERNIADPNSLSANSVFSIYKDSFGDLWVGTDVAGLNRMKSNTNKFIHYINIPNDPHGISNNTINSICEDSQGNLWIGTNGGGLNKFNRATNSFSHFTHNPDDPSTISSDRITQLFLDSKSNLWIGISPGGFDKLLEDQTTVIHYQPDASNPNSISNDMIFDFNEDQSGNMWIGTHGGGLFRFNIETEKFTIFKNDPKNPSSLSSNSISVIHIDKKGIMWIGTDGLGLNKYNSDEKTFKHFNEKDGLPNDVICGILEDAKGNLWISTYKGISKFDPETERFRNFGVENGLQGLEFNNWAYFKDKTGRMYFGGTNGLNVFHPDSLKDNLFVPPIVITDFQILHKPVSIGYDSLWGRTILEKSISETDHIELNYDDNIISFEFAALDYRNPERNQYSYFLEGFDKRWIFTDANKRYVTYTNLDPGEYVFRVKGSNNDGIWNKEGTSLRIRIIPPWWSRWWAYVLYGFVSALIFFGSTRFYLNREKLKTQLKLEKEQALKLEEVDRIKSHFYANISHEFRTPLQLILGPLEKLAVKISDEEGKKQAGLIRVNAHRLLNLINQLLDLARLEAKKLKLQASRGNIALFVRRIVKEFESITEQRDIALKINMDRENIIAYFDKEKLEKVIINVMSNAVKFTPKGGRITVLVSETPNKGVDIIVRDSGIGIPAKDLNKIFDKFYQVDSSHTREHEGTGIGLALTKEFVDLHRGEISIDSMEGHWTEVKLNFPLGREHLKDDEIVDSDEFTKESIEELAEFGEDEMEILDDENSFIDKTIVLVVEDNQDLREYINDDLKSIYHVIEAANGEQGFRKAEKIIPDLIVSDVMMPVMDGYELTRQLRKNEKTSHIPIILLTAKSDRESKLEGLELGADDYLTKPFDTEELLVRIKNLIETRKLLQEKYGSGSAVIQKNEKQKISFLDQQFLDRVLKVINEHISEEEFSIEEFGKDVGMSRSQMHRKLKALTGKSASLYLRTVRLAKAKQMIEDRMGNISDISYQVGFSSPAYFSRCFKEEFGYAPSEYNNKS